MSNATSYSPFRALYGQHSRIPTTIATNPSNDCEVLQDGRTWQGAQAALATERDVIKKKQEEKKLAGPLSLGDAVVLLKAGLPVTFKLKGSARWEVIRGKAPRILD